MAVPYTFGSILGGASIPLSELDDNFSYLTTSPTFTGNVTVNGILDVNGNESYFGGSNPGAYNGISIVNSSPTGYCTVAWVVGAAGANGVANVNYAPGVFLKFGVLANDTTSPIVFVNNNDQERMRIDASGNVGIGTSSPGARLAIYDPSTCTLNITEGVGGTSAQLAQTSASDTVLTNYANARSLFLQQVGLGSIVFVINSSEKMRIDASGNVGIGTTSPTEKFDVQGDAIRLRTAKTPASATAAGTQGQVCWDSNYVYVCVATNTWKRAALATW